MVEGNSEYISKLTAVLITLASYYAKCQFEEQSPNEYFSEVVSSRFKWHRIISEPDGYGTGGTIVNISVGGGVIDDLEKMIQDMVIELMVDEDSFDWRGWKALWRGKI